MSRVITGAILAGGKSLRFGRNKALETFRGERLIDRGVQALRPFCDPVFVVANDLGLYLDVRATLIQDLLPHQGPLGGIYSALFFSPREWVLVRATDMPLLVPEVASRMLSLKKGVDVVVPLCNELYEPLLALYNRRCIPHIVDLLSRGERKIIHLFKKVRVRQFPEAMWREVDPEGLSFKNVNTPQDLEQL